MSATSAFDPMSQSQPATSDDVFLAFVQEHFDPIFYRESNADVAESGLDPLEHWLNHGLHEGRQISSHIVLRTGKTARRSTNRIWRHYRWRETDIAARVIPPLPQNVLAQIIDQARHEPAILAAGADAVANLPQQDRENVHLDVAALRHALPHTAEILFVLPDLGLSEDGRLAADLIAVLSEVGPRFLQIIVADQESTDEIDEPPAPFRQANILFWRDFWIHGPEHVRLGQLAQLIHVLRPHAMIVGDSAEGREMAARYGRALSAHMKMFCLCVAADADRYAASCPQRALSFDALLTDDATMAARLREQLGRDLAHRIKLLPRHPASSFSDCVAHLFARK